MSLGRLAALAIVGLLLAAVIFATLTVAGRILRRTADRRRSRLAAPARRLLVRLIAGDDDPSLVDQLAAIEPVVWRAVEPTAIAMLGKVRGEAHSALVTVFRRRGEAGRALSDVRALGSVRRARAAEVLGTLNDADSLRALERLLRDPSPDVRVVAARSLGRIGDPRAARALLGATAGRHPVPPQLAAQAVIRLGLAAQGEVAAALDHPSDVVRATATEVLGLIGAVGATARVATALRCDPSAEVRLRAACALGRLGTRSALAPLLAAVESDRPTALRVEAASALGELGAPAAAEPLAALLADDAYRVAHHAARALLLLGRPGRAALESALRAPAGVAPDLARVADGRGAVDTTGPAGLRDLRDPVARAAAHAREALAHADVEAGRRSQVVTSAA